MKLYVRFFTFFYGFFQNPKKHDFLRFFELLHAFSRTVTLMTFDKQSNGRRIEVESWLTVAWKLATVTDVSFQFASGCVVECRICNREVAHSNLSLGYFAPRSTQPSIPLESVNEYQL